MTVANDGFVDYTLGQDYGDSKSGTTIRVDPERKKWLDEHGYTRKPSVSVVIADSAIGDRFVNPELRHPPFTDDKEI